MGHFLVNEKDIKGRWDYRRDIGYVPQIARFPENLKVKELIHMVRDIRGNHSTEAQLIERFELGTFMDKPLRYLSGGTRRAKAAVLVQYFYLLVFDRATDAADPPVIRMIGGNPSRLGGSKVRRWWAIQDSNL